MERGKENKGTLVLHGLFDVKSLEAGTEKYLYLHTYPEEGTRITTVSSMDESVVKVESGNNGNANVTMDDVSGENCNYNYVKLSALKTGHTSVSVTVEDENGELGSITKTFDVQVIAPRYAGTERVVLDLSNGWQFLLERDMKEIPRAGCVPETDKNWENVTIPHCWNAWDGADGGGDYHRGIGWYTRKFSKDELEEIITCGKQLYLEIGAACKVSEVYVNGIHLAHHEGGYSLFRVDVTDAFKWEEENVVAVSVDNRVNDLTPLSGDFTVFGGFYRGVRLVAVGDLHMDLDQKTSFGGCGLYVSQRGANGITPDMKPEKVFAEGGRLTIRGEVKNSAAEVRKVCAFAAVYDAEWHKEAEYEFDMVELASGERHCFEQELCVKNPHLWDGVKDPYQYNVVFEVKDENGCVTDRERCRIGFRFYAVDPERGFFLNGHSYPLRGVSTHQDRFGKGNAVSHQDREQDMALIAELGANAIRFAHYQHDPFVYELAGERGITAWAEIPMVNAIVNTWDFYESTMRNQNEMIRQCFNCTAIIVWGDHNEQWPNNKGINVLLNLLYQNAKKQDPSRLIALATAQPPSDTALDDEMGIALSWQSDVSAWNKYFGLYQGLDARYFGTWVNDVHKYGLRHETVYGTENGIVDPDGKVCDIPVRVHGNVGMGEYGVEGNPYVHDENPGYWDDMNNRSEEWQSQWHEIHYKAISEAEWMWSSYIWNMFEFGSDNRPDPGRQGTNNKGIVSYDRTIKKDVYYFYKANWSQEPTLYISSKRFTERKQESIRVKVYSNMETVELFADGVSQGVLAAGENKEAAVNLEGEADTRLIPNTQLGKFEWMVRLSGLGLHEIVAVGTKEGKTYVDKREWRRVRTEAEKETPDKDNAGHTKQDENVEHAETISALDVEKMCSCGLNTPISSCMPIRIRNNGSFPVAFTVEMTNPKSTDDYYYLTGIRVHFYEGDETCCNNKKIPKSEMCLGTVQKDQKENPYVYGYNISANNIVGIPTGFVVDAADNKNTGWMEHWTEEGTNQVKDVTLNVQRGIKPKEGAEASVHEILVYAWRIVGHSYKVDEIRKTITIQKEKAPVTVEELCSGLQIRGNCFVTFFSADGKELCKKDGLEGGCRMAVTDVKNHVFYYTIVEK